MRGRTSALVLALLVAPGSSLAQRGAPPRDSMRRLAPSGTAAIEGVVQLDDDTGKGMRRAIVTVSSANLPGGRTVITGDDGRYRIDGLPAGRYRLRASKGGYVPMAFGARRPSGAGASIAVADGQTAAGINVRLPRGAVIAGLVLDPEGQPLPGAVVTALGWRYVDSAGERRLIPAGISTTDDRGEYRIFGLPAGEYLVGAAAHGPNTSNLGLEVITDAEMRRALADVRTGPQTRTRPGIPLPSPPVSKAPVAERQAVSYAPVYFPGTTDVGAASLVPLRQAEERMGVDIPVDYVPTARVSGFVSGFPDTEGSDIVVLLSPGERTVPADGLRATRVRPGGGAFSFDRVSPGHYMLIARSGRVLARTEVTVNGEELSGILLMPLTPISLSGRIAFEGATAPPANLAGLRVTLPAVQFIGASQVSLPAPQIDAAGRFTISVIPGTYRVMGVIPGLRTPIGPWFVKSATVNGRDILDSIIELDRGFDDLVITFSDRATELSGRVVSVTGDPPVDSYVLVLPVSREQWYPNSRRVAAVRARDDGTFTIRNLPPGNYLATAAYLEPGEWGDPQVLERLSAGAVKLTLGEAEKKTQDLRVR